MSTREIAHSIINQLSEDQLVRFIIQYKEQISTNSEQQKRNEAFEELMKLRRTVALDFCEQKEYEDYLDERFGT